MGVLTHVVPGIADPEHVARFSGLYLPVKPGEYTVTFTVGVKTIPAVNLHVSVGPCNLGEVLGKSANSVTCTACEAGQYSTHPSAEECTKCDVNYYQSEPQTTSCEPCAMGLYAAQPGSTKCIEQTPDRVFLTSVSHASGDFKEITFAWAYAIVDEVAPGMVYSYELSSDAAFSVGNQLYNSSNVDWDTTEATFVLQTPLYEVPVFFRIRAELGEAIGEWSSTNQAWRTVDVCADSSVFLLAQDPDPRTWMCATCPVGTLCDGPVFHSQMKTAPGFSRVDWAPSTLSDALRCPYPYACPGGPVTTAPSDLCVNGTMGPLCTVCKPGYGYQFGECQPCTVQNIGVVLGIFSAVLVLLGFLAFLLRRKLRKYGHMWADFMGVIKMAVDFMQITSAVPDLINLSWPPIYYQFLSYFDFVNADLLSMTGASCVSGMNFNLKYFGISMLPILAFVYGCIAYCQKTKQHRNKEVVRAKLSGEHTKRLEWVENHEYLKDTFRAIDADGSGRIDVEELQQLLVSFGYQIKLAQTRTLMETLLGKGHLTISQTAFLALYESGMLANELKMIRTKGKGAVHDSQGLRGWSESRKIIGSSFAVTLQILMLVHTPVTKKTFLFFNCHEMYGRSFMRADYSIECWASEAFLLFLPFVLTIMIVFVIGLPSLISYYLWDHRKQLHSVVIKEKIGFLYDRFNIGAEGWEVHEIVKKGLLTGAIVFISDPLLQTTAAIVVSAVALCNLNYLRPHKNKTLFWIGQVSFFVTLLVFLFAVVLLGANQKGDKSTEEVIGIILIVLNIVVVVVAAASITLQVLKILHRLKTVEKNAKKSKLQIEPLDSSSTSKKSIRDYGQRIINATTPIAVRNMMEFTRVTFGAGSGEYNRMMTVLKDLKDDKIAHKRDLIRRVDAIFHKQSSAVQVDAMQYANDLWLV